MAEAVREKPRKSKTKKDGKVKKAKKKEETKEEFPTVSTDSTFSKILDQSEKEDSDSLSSVLQDLKTTETESPEKKLHTEQKPETAEEKPATEAKQEPKVTENDPKPLPPEPTEVISSASLSDEIAVEGSVCVDVKTELKDSETEVPEERKEASIADITSDSVTTKGSRAVPTVDQLEDKAAEGSDGPSSVVETAKDSEPDIVGDKQPTADGANPENLAEVDKGIKTGDLSKAEELGGESSQCTSSREVDTSANSGTESKSDHLYPSLPSVESNRVPVFERSRPAAVNTGESQEDEFYSFQKEDTATEQLDVLEPKAIALEQPETQEESAIASDDITPEEPVEQDKEEAHESSPQVPVLTNQTAAEDQKDQLVGAVGGLTLESQCEHEDSFEFVPKTPTEDTHQIQTETPQVQEKSKDVSVAIESFPQPEPIKPEVREEAKPEPPQAAPAKEPVIHRRLYAESTEAFKPMTIEQIQNLYYNPQLAKNPQFIESFIVHEAKKDSHEFFEILLSYFRSRKNLISSEEDVKGLQSNYVKLQEEMWITTTKSISAQSMCGDGSKVSTTHLYEMCKLNEDALHSMQVTLQSIRDHIQEELTLHAYSSQLSKLQVESYIHNLFMNSPALRDIPKNSPVHASGSQQTGLRHEIQKLKDCISVLFIFHRRPIKDVEFVTNIRQWTDRLVAALLRLATFEDHLFLLNHVLRCPAGVGKWGTKLIQVPPPSSSPQQGSMGNPLLDHLVTALATLLFPTQSREEFMSQMRTSLTPDSMQMENTWILVDSDGEEDEDPSNAWLYLHENDIVAMLRQFPVTAVFAHVLKATFNESGSPDYNILLTNEADMMRVFAFCTCWVNLLGSGLQTYCMARYRQLNKRLGKMIRQTVSYVSDHWLNFKASNSGRLSTTTLTRVQMEFDQFFMRSTYCILTAQKLGSWQFMADMPFTCVSSSSMWQLLWVLHQGQSHTLNLDTLPPVQYCEGYLKDPNSRQQLADNLLNLQTSETIYLLTTFANMAQCRPSEEEDFIQTVSFGVFEISYTCSHTREFCSKVGRELLSSIVIRHPFILSLLLQRSKEVMPKLGMMSLYLFRELPMWSWSPSDPDMLVLRQWLLQSDLAQPENQLARLILSRMNWSFHQQSKMLVLPLRLHRQVALLLVEAYTKYISSRHMGAVIGEGIRQMASVVRQHQTQEQNFNNWTWDLLLKLKLHHHNFVCPGQEVAPEMAPLDLLKDDWLMPVVKGLKLKNPVACFVALAMTNVGHNTTTFVTEGMDYLLSISSWYQFTAVLHILSCIAPYFYASPQYYMHSDGFLKIQQSLLAADESLFKMAKSVLGSQFPGTVTKQFADMILCEVSKNAIIGRETQVLIFWLKALMKVPRWSTDRNCCYIVDRLVERAFLIAGALEEVKTVFIQAFKELRKNDTSQGLMTSVVSWIASGVTVPSLMERNSFPEFTWLAYMILVVEAEYEAEIKLWLSLVQDMYADTKLSADQALKRVIPRLKLDQAPALHRLNIYRWGQQALDSPVSHPLLPVLWQRFFLLYLGRQVFDSSLPQRASVGERFFDTMSLTSMLKKMKKRLEESADYHINAHSDETTEGEGAGAEKEKSEYRSNKEFHQKLARLYQTYALWMEEPRLHDANLYLPSLPPQYESARLLQVFQNQMSPWLEFIDLDSVHKCLSDAARDWRKLVDASSSDDLRGAKFNNEFDPSNAAKRILMRLRDYDPPLDPPALCTLKAPVPDISIAILEEKHSLIHLLDADLNTLRDHTRVFSTRVAQHCAVDGAYLDLLPELYTNELKQITLTIECKSKVNPIHRCSNPAVANVQVQEKTMKQSVLRKIDENRAEYKQVMIECLLPPPSTVCISAVHVENAITMLIKLSQSTTDEGKRAVLFDIASTLFFHLASMVNEDTNFYLPTKQFFASCLEILGQEFLSQDRSQTLLLLQFSLDNPSLSGHVSPHFIPNNSPESYVPMYEQLIHVLQKRNMTLVFTLLTKFDVWTWLQTSKPPQAERKRFVGILGSALMACGAEPEKTTKLVFDLYCSHLHSFLQTNFPENLADVLALVIQGSAVERLHVQCWEILLGECFTPMLQNPGERKPSLRFSLVDVENSTDTRLSTTQLTETLQWLSSQMMQLRIRDPEAATFGLYPRWNRYTPYVSHFLGGLMRSYVTKMLPNFTEMNPYQVLDMTWKHVLDLFAPWIQPLVNPQHTWYPWIESDSDIALAMVAMFRKVVDFVRTQFSGKIPDMSGRVLGMLLLYYMNCMCASQLPVHVSEIFTQELQRLPWEQFNPDLQLLEMMSQLKERVATHCFHLIGSVLVRVKWGELIQYLMMYQSPEMTSRFQAALLILLIQCYGDSQLLEKPETVQLLTSAENFNWLYVSSGSYRVASNWFMQTCDPKCVLAERSSSLALALKLMRVAAGFSADPGIPWSEDLSTKRLMFVHCMTQLLCQCSYRSEVNIESMGTVVVNLLSEIESVETSVSDLVTQQQESLDLVKDVLSLLNNCNPEGESLSVVMASIRDWLQSSPHSILLTPCIKAASRCLASLQQMVQIMETCIEVYFTADQSENTSGEWSHILAVFQMPELNTEDCVGEAISQGSYLTLYSHVLQQLSLAQTPQDEVRLINLLVSWTTQAKAGSENEGKLLLWWHKLLELTLKQLDTGGADSQVRARCITSLNLLLNHLILLGEDRTSSGLLGAIGLGKKSTLSPKFRIICRTLAAFLATQIYSNTDLRLQTQQPLSNTPTAKQTRSALNQLKSNKQYAKYKEFIDMVSLSVQDNMMCFRDSLALLQQLVQAFFSDLNYLRCIH